jgi:hypothetical protein
VLSGTLDDPYTGTAIAFQRGRHTSWEVQVDHVVALLDAWQKGAQQLDEATRQNLANDPANLQATEGSINEQKGAGDCRNMVAAQQVLPLHLRDPNRGRQGYLRTVGHQGRTRRDHTDPE